MTMTKYVYKTQLQVEQEFIRDHQRHTVRVTGTHWLLCRTCGIPLCFSERRAVDVLREDFGRVE